MMIYKFKTRETPALTLVGGKARALIETTRAGFSVPEGFVLSVAFFETWTREIKGSDTWKACLKIPTKELCDALKAQAAAMVFTREQRKSLEDALAELPEKSLFAVRSSSPEEDLVGASFAGMYETFLGTTRAKLETAIAGAYSSMLNIRVMEYKVQHNISLEETAISVIVQQQIDSKVSGVGFSLNPLNNCFDEAVINASFGLGEAIVSGIVTPDTYVVEKIRMEILEKTIGEKKFALHLAASGGTLQEDNREPEAPALGDEQILELTELIKKCEGHYGFPVDIEWTYAEGQLYLLQARPVTTYVPLFPEMITKPGERKKLYMDIIPLSQGFDESLSVLGGDIWAIVLERLKRGTTPAGEGGYILNIAGRQYFLLHNMFKGMGKKLGMRLPGTWDNAFIGQEQEIFKEYMNSETTRLIKQAKKAQLRLIFEILPSIIRVMLNPEKQVEKLILTVQDMMKQFKAMKNDRPLGQLVDFAFNLFDEHYYNFIVHVGGLLTEQKIKKMMKGTEVEELTKSILMDLPSNPTSAMGHAMFALAKFPELRETRVAAEFEQKYTQRLYSSEFMAALDDYMYKYGERGFKEIDVASKRVAERLDEFFLQLKSLNLEDNQLLRVTTRKAEALEKMRAVAKRKGKLKAFNKAVNSINLTYGHRETPKYLLVVLNGCLHKIALQIGEEFVTQGRLKDREQIFDLNLEQISRAQEEKSMPLMPIIEENLKPYKLMEKVRQFPCFIDSRGKIFRKILKAEEGDIVGMAVSPGVIRGKAKVLASPYEKPLEPGEILVTVATEPSWTPIFVNASGVVLEVGGGLQHGAIIAREYGLPCVSGLPGITEIIKDGDLLEVDGTNGILKIINAG
jgi:pyruvate,water dikinase